MVRTCRAIAGVLAIALVTAGSAQGAITAAEKCAEAKQKAAAKKLSSKLKCYATAAKKNVGLDPECLTKAEDKFTETFAKAEGAGGCVKTGDAASVENGVDTFLSYLLSNTTQPACGGFLFCGGSCPLGTSCTGYYDPTTGILLFCSCS